VIALGPMRRFIRAAMNESFVDVQASGPANAERIVVSESLGSFAVLDAMKDPHPGVRSFLERTADLYFFANQFALLELARLDGIGAEGAVGAEEAAIEEAPEERSVLGVLEELGPVRLAANALEAFPAGVEPVEPRQVIAFSDPSDMLSWRVPKLAGVKVINLYAATSGGPFPLFANPVKAHRGAITSRRVWRLLLQGKR
jgi:hypothetical protein